MAFLALGSTFAAVADFSPTSIDFATLIDADEFHKTGAATLMKDALASSGILAITGIPQYSALRPAVLRDGHSCGAISPAAQAQHFEDGTVRCRCDSKRGLPSSPHPFLSALL